MAVLSAGQRKDGGGWRLPFPFIFEVHRAHSPDRRPVRRRSVGPAARRLLVRRPDADPTPSATESAAADLCASAAPSGSISEGVVVTGDAGSEATVDVRRRRSRSRAPSAPSSSRATATRSPRATSSSTARRSSTPRPASSSSPAATTARSCRCRCPSGSGADQFFGCATEGSRIVMAFPGSDQAAASVWVLDVLGTTPAAAWGEPQDPVAGMPTVELDDDGAPTVTIPEGDAPTEVADRDPQEGRRRRREPGRHRPRALHRRQVVGRHRLRLELGARRPGVVRDDRRRRGIQAGARGADRRLAGARGDPAGVRLRRRSEGHELQDETLVFVVDILGTQSPAPAQ